MLLGDRGVSTHSPFASGVAATIIEPINVKGFLKRQKKNNKKQLLALLLQSYHLNICVYLCIDSSEMVVE